MPMSFPDMSSLQYAARVHKFREPTEGESESVYRKHLADHVEQKGDLIESMEIRTSRGWDKFSEAENIEMLLRGMSKNR